MTRVQSIILNILGALVALLIIGNLVLSQLNQGLGNGVMQRQAVINNAQQAETYLRNIGLRIAQFADKDSDFRKLMIKYDLKATIMVDGKPREVP